MSTNEIEWSFFFTFLDLFFTGFECYSELELINGTVHNEHTNNDMSEETERLFSLTTRLREVGADRKLLKLITHDTIQIRGHIKIPSPVHVQT